MSELQRARLLGGAVLAVEELGYGSATVAHITHRARVSRRTFYDLFANREDCLLAVLQDTVARIAAELAAEGVAELPWRERVRAGLWTILCFFDREPALARVCVVRSASGAQRTLEYRQEILASLAGAITEGGGGGPRTRARSVPSLTAEGLVGGIVSILYTRLLAREHEPLSGLLGELMGMIALAYLGPAAAGRERGRPAPEPPTLAATGADTGVSVWQDDPLREIPMRLTYRTARVLEVTATHPGASNRVVGERAGIFDQGQVSKLLARLERLGLLANSGAGHTKGEPNAWRLTPKGEQVTQSISSRYPRELT